MSIGYGGNARKEAEDEELVIYTYMSYNLNDPAHRNTDRVFDGSITVAKSAFPKREFTKRGKVIDVDIDFDELIESGEIIIANSQNTWHTLVKGEDFIAMRLCFKVFDGYRQDGCLPDYISLNV